MVAADDPRLAKVGFAKLVGSGIELYAKKHEITLGRLSKSGHVDIVLGENMNISRQHARIAYSKESGQWELHVLGKNGVTLHGTLLTPENPPHPLRSQDMIQIAEKQFHFLLPKDPQWPAQGVVSQPAAATVQQQAAPQMAAQPPAAAAQDAGVHSSAPAPVSSLASVGPGHSLFQHLHKVLQPSLDRELAASATRQPSMSAGSPQQMQQVPAGVSLPPSMARIAAALPPGQQQVMMQQMAMVMQKQMHMQQQQAGMASDAPAHEQLQAMQAAQAQTQAGELMERLRAQGMAMNRQGSGQAPGMDRMPSGQAHGHEGA